MINTKNRKISDSFVLQPTELTQKKRKYESMALSDQMPIAWDRAENYSVFDRDGNKWIDMTAGIFTTNAGHSNPLVCDAIKKQVDKLKEQYASVVPDDETIMTGVLRVSRNLPQYLARSLFNLYQIHQGIKIDATRQAREKTVNYDTFGRFILLFYRGYSKNVQDDG